MLLLVMGKERCEMKGYGEEWLVQAGNDAGTAVVERKASLVPHHGAAAGRADYHSSENAAPQGLLMLRYGATHATPLTTQVHQESASANVGCAEVENL